MTPTGSIVIAMGGENEAIYCRMNATHRNKGIPPSFNPEMDSVPMTPKGSVMIAMGGENEAIYCRMNATHRG